MFKAIGKFFRTLGYILTGQINKVSVKWGKSQEVVEAKYEAVIEEKRKRLTSYKEAVGGLIANQERKKAKLKDLTEEIQKLDKLRQGALAKANTLATSLGDPEAVKTNADYLKCKAAYKDFTTTWDEKSKRILDLENDIKGIDGQVASHKVQIEGLMRDLDKVKDEKYETKASIAAAEEKKKIADLFAGISEDKTDQELQELRELRQNADAQARVSSELSGLDAKRSEEEFLAYATDSVVDDEFDKLIGLTKKETVTTPVVETRISEQ